MERVPRLPAWSALPPSLLQVTVEYKRDPECQGALIPKRVHTILISTQHNPDVTNDQIRKV